MALNPFSKSIFVFCSKNRRTTKAILLDGSGCLFEELELLAQFEAKKNGLPESEQIVVEAHTRKKHKTRDNSTLPAYTPVIDVYNYEESLMTLFLFCNNNFISIL